MRRSQTSAEEHSVRLCYYLKIEDVTGFYIFLDVKRGIAYSSSGYPENLLQDFPFTQHKNKNLHNMYNM